MAIESITDENYFDFRKSSRAVLMISTATCPKCREFLPILETIEKQNQQIRFGKTYLEQGHSVQLKKEYPDIGRWILPTTLLFRENLEVGRIYGGLLYPQTLSKIQERLILGTTVYVHNGGLYYIPAIIKKMDGRQSPYHLQLLEKSLLGEKGAIIQIDESQIKWNL